MLCWQAAELKAAAAERSEQLFAQPLQGVGR